MAAKKRPPLTGLTSGSSALSRHVASKGEGVQDAPARAAAEKAAGGAGMRYMQTRLSDAGWKALKLLAVELERPLQGLVIDALNDFLRKHGKAPDVTGPDSDARAK